MQFLDLCNYTVLYLGLLILYRQQKYYIPPELRNPKKNRKFETISNEAINLRRSLQNKERISKSVGFSTQQPSSMPNFLYIGFFHILSHYPSKE